MLLVFHIFTVLVWEWDIGVPIKYISDPTMHAMPCLVMHPSHQFFIGQSLDNVSDRPKFVVFPIHRTMNFPLF
jgi:hypothetical protein